MVGGVVPKLTTRHFDRPPLRRCAVAPFENKVDLFPLFMAIRECFALLTDKVEDADNNERLPSRPDETFESLLAEVLDRYSISRSLLRQADGNGCALLDQSPMLPAVADRERFVTVIPPGRLRSIATARMPLSHQMSPSRLSPRCGSSVKVSGRSVCRSNVTRTSLDGSSRLGLPPS